MSLLCVAREMELQGVRHGEKEMPLILRGGAKTGRDENHRAWPDLSGALGMQRRHRGDGGGGGMTKEERDLKEDRRNDESF